VTRFLSRLFLICLPLLALVVVDLALPLNAFTFRCWEALRVTWRIADTSLGRLFPYTALPGPFLPNERITMLEQGDLGHHTPYAEFRRVSSETDASGFRVRPSSVAPELVLVGDSETVGSGLTQDETLAAVLGTAHGIASYPFAPADEVGFLGDPRLQQRPHRAVDIESAQRYVLAEFHAVRQPLRRKPVSSHALEKLEVELLRIQRLNALEYLRARVNGNFRPNTIVLADMLFWEPTVAAAPPEDVTAAASTFAQYARQLRARGMRVAVLVVPNKETIYSDVLAGSPVPRLLPMLYSQLLGRGVDVLDVVPAFHEAREAGAPPFFRDDTHWNTTGVRIAAAKIADWMHRGAAGAAAQ